MLLEYGTVIHAPVKELDKRDGKFLVCISEELSWFLTINTKNREIYECIEISAENYQFLKKQNRFISCSRFFNIKEKGLEGAKLISKISEKDMLKVYNKIQQSNKWTPHNKKKVIHKV